MARLHSAAALLLLLAAACGDPDPATIYADPTDLSVPSEASGIRAWVVSPTSSAQLTDAFPTITLAAHSITGSDVLEVQLAKLERDAAGHTVELSTAEATSTGTPGPLQRFTASVALTHGRNSLLARIRSRDGLKVRTLSFELDYKGANPGATLGVALPNSDAGSGCSYGAELSPAVTNAPAVCLHGRVTSLDNGTRQARIVAPAEAAQALTLDAQGAFSQRVNLAGEGVRSLTLELTDGSGATQRVSTDVVHDTTPPRLTITSMARETLDASYMLEGNVEDAFGVADVQVATSAGSKERLGAVSPFSLPLTLSAGDNGITVTATDIAGNQSSEELTLHRVRKLELGAPQRDVGTTDIEVDRQALSELLTEADQRDIAIVSIDMTSAVRESLARIRTPERYAVDTAGWGAPEHNLQRILQMTPDVANLSGTSMAELLNIAAAVGLPTPRILGDILELRTTDYVLDLETAAAVIVDKLVGSHPNVDRTPEGQAVLTITLADVLQDLAPLAARFGASGSHPGFLAGKTLSRVLEPGFLITFPVHSNLVQLDAIDLSRATKDFVFALAGERVLDFNVLTDDFNVVGLTDQPTIDLRFTLQESPTFVRSGATENVNTDAKDPGFYRGNGGAFALAPYYFEYIAAETTYRQLHRNFSETGYQRTLRYDAGSIKDAAVIGWNRGFLRVSTAGNLGSPPAPLYAWDLLTEVAQVRLHDGRIAEGAANMAFDLNDVPIGLSASDLVERLRPKLHTQEGKLSEQLAGKTGLAKTAADVFYVPPVGAGGGAGSLVFRAREDSGGPYDYPHVGLYADAALTQKKSTPIMLPELGNAAREAVQVSVGDTLYAADQDGSVHAIRIVEKAGTGVSIQVTHVAVTP
jgi:hypothetical protein